MGLETLDLSKLQVDVIDRIESHLYLLDPFQKRKSLFMQYHTIYVASDIYPCVRDLLVVLYEATRGNSKQFQLINEIHKDFIERMLIENGKTLMEVPYTNVALALEAYFSIYPHIALGLKLL